MALAFKHGDDPLRVYLDTSVFGGCFDALFAKDSLRLVDAVQHGRLRALISEVVATELAAAPEAVQNVLVRMGDENVQYVPLSSHVRTLQQAYLAEGILSPPSADDALHVAAATVAGADAIVSWNFKHIVRLDKIKAYNRVNVAAGYDDLTILSPKEVGFNDPETD